MMWTKIFLLLLRCGSSSCMGCCEIHGLPQCAAGATGPHARASMPTRKPARAPIERAPNPTPGTSFQQHRPRTWTRHRRPRTWARHRHPCTSNRPRRARTWAHHYCQCTSAPPHHLCIWTQHRRARTWTRIAVCAHGLMHAHTQFEQLHDQQHCLQGKSKAE